MMPPYLPRTPPRSLRQCALLLPHRLVQAASPGVLSNPLSILSLTLSLPFSLSESEMLCSPLLQSLNQLRQIQMGTTTLSLSVVSHIVLTP